CRRSAAMSLGPFHSGTGSHSRHQEPREGPSRTLMWVSMRTSNGLWPPLPRSPSLRGLPMSASDDGFFAAGGTLPPDARSYVERQAARALFDALAAGEFAYVPTSRQMGKSSLMIRTAARLRAAGATVVVLDLTAIGQNLSVEQWYASLLGLVGEQLGLEDDL